MLRERRDNNLTQIRSNIDDLKWKFFPIRVLQYLNYNQRLINTFEFDPVTGKLKEQLPELTYELNNNLIDLLYNGFTLKKQKPKLEDVLKQLRKYDLITKEEEKTIKSLTDALSLNMTDSIETTHPESGTRALLSKKLAEIFNNNEKEFRLFLRKKLTVLFESYQVYPQPLLIQLIQLIKEIQEEEEDNNNNNLTKEERTLRLEKIKELYNQYYNSILLQFSYECPRVYSDRRETLIENPYDAARSTKLDLNNFELNQFYLTKFIAVNKKQRGRCIFYKRLDSSYPCDDNGQAVCFYFYNERFIPKLQEILSKFCFATDETYQNIIQELLQLYPNFIPQNLECITFHLCAAHLPRKYLDPTYGGRKSWLSLLEVSAGNYRQTIYYQYTKKGLSTFQMKNLKYLLITGLRKGNLELTIEPRQINKKQINDLGDIDKEVRVKRWGREVTLKRDDKFYFKLGLLMLHAAEKFAFTFDRSSFLIENFLKKTLRKKRKKGWRRFEPVLNLMRRRKRSSLTSNENEDEDEDETENERPRKRRNRRNRPKLKNKEEEKQNENE